MIAMGCGDSDADSTAKRSTRQPPREPVPASLGAVESSAEDIVDFARQGKRARAEAAARALRREAEGDASAALGRAGTPEARIAELQRRARRVEALAPRAGALRLALAANDVSGLMPELYARYSDPVPPAVLRLDYLDREAQLRSLAGERAAVAAAVSGLASTWSALAPAVLHAGGDAVAERYARHVADMRRLARGSGERALQREAVHGLALVDELEHAFRRG